MTCLCRGQLAITCITSVSATGCSPERVSCHASSYVDKPLWWRASPSAQTPSCCVGSPRKGGPQSGTSPTYVWADGPGCIHRHSCSSRHVCIGFETPTCRWSLSCPRVTMLRVRSLFLFLFNKFTHFDRAVIVEPSQELSRVPICIRRFPFPIRPDELRFVPGKTAARQSCNYTVFILRIWRCVCACDAYLTTRS